MKQKQSWVCEDCGLTGATEYDPREGVFAVVRALRDHHETLASKYAPTCHFDIDRVRVRNPELMDEYEWNRSVVEIERKTAHKRSPQL
jgi:hypothetical protein